MLSAGRVTVIDYGIGNILSVARAFAHFKAEVRLTDSPSEIEKAERLVLPGVGAFKDGMEGLRQKDLVPAIQRYSKSGRPLLGICLGMQMMMETSEEFGQHEGLGLIPGNVVAIGATGTDGKKHKVPHIGWNGLRIPAHNTPWDSTLFTGIAAGEAVYFVHSFTVSPQDEKNRLADADYDGCVISAAVRSGNLYGCQFHPEKSGATGLKIIKNFIGMK